ncbi:MAG TPA: UbiA family prenyltransferase [Candidatus Binatia bacterium]|nr:UbiA family prenyltransferase [Candidatus Binatia bacterium]
MEQGVNKRSGSSPEDVPLVIDLDGTLLRTDLLLESALRLIKQRPWLVLLLPIWFLRGRAYLKRKVSQAVKIDVSLLPAHEELLTWLRQEKAGGRRLILATASDYQQACSVAATLGLFDTVLGSDGQRNLKGRKKLKTLVDVCGERFDYAGNSSADLAIWQGCRQAILVNTSKRVERLARRAGNVARVFSGSRTGFRDGVRSMRFQRWAKNLLVFVPAITSQTLFDGPVFGSATLAFFSFGLAASSAYILNDLLDLEEDRRHPTQKQRPLASGRMFIGSGMLLAIAALSASLLIASLLPGAFGAALIAYLVLTSLYSLFLKRFLVTDVLVTALLYTVRLIAGYLAIAIPLSLQILSWAFVFFLSLVFAARVLELFRSPLVNRDVVEGAGTRTQRKRSDPGPLE